MKHGFAIGVALVLGLFGLCVYWYVHPHRAPLFVRQSFSGFKISGPTSPMSNFRPPAFGR